MYVESDTGVWTKTHPYAIELRKLLNRDNSTLIESGISGESSEHMVTRIHKVLQSIKPTLAIILGGTNELGPPHITSEMILNNLKRIHHQVLEISFKTNKPVYTIVLTIPYCNWGGEQGLKKRLDINIGLREFATKCSERVQLVDLENIFDQSVASDKIYWSPDHVHFSPKGYDEIGKHIYDKISTFEVSSSPSDNEVFLKQCFPSKVGTSTGKHSAVHHHALRGENNDK